MKISDIPQVAAWLSVAGIATYELTGPDYRIRLRRSIKARPRASDPKVDPPLRSNSMLNPLSSASLGAGGGVSAGSGQDAAVPARGQPDVVVSPGVGLFLHAHPVQETALAEPNEPVAAGQPVGFLQIGPILLPVLSPRDGVVAAIVAPDRSLVGYGEPLVALMP
jgi:acetyl-CoA carboxylase biotin carboxyl carrier protein